MKNLIFIFTLIFVFFPLKTNADCLEYGILSVIDDKNSIFFLEKSFPICVKLNNCKTAKHELEKLKYKDSTRYEYLMGSALANGDCFKKNIAESEKLLMSCAQESVFCARNLVKLYGLYAKDLSRYEQGVVSLATSGDLYSIFLLIDIYTEKYLDINNMFKKEGPLYGMHAYTYCRYATHLLRKEIDSFKNTKTKDGKLVKRNLEKALSIIKQREEWLENIFGKDKLKFIEKDLKNQVEVTHKYMNSNIFENDKNFATNIMYKITGIPYTKNGYNNIKQIKFYEKNNKMERISGQMINLILPY